MQMLYCIPASGLYANSQQPVIQSTPNVLESTVNLEIFVVKIFSWSIEATKIKITKLKCMRMLQCGTGRSYENIFTRTFFQRKFHYTKISGFTVLGCLVTSNKQTHTHTHTHTHAHTHTHTYTHTHTHTQ